MMNPSIDVNLSIGGKTLKFQSIGDAADWIVRLDRINEIIVRLDLLDGLWGDGEDEMKFVNDCIVLLNEVKEIYLNYGKEYVPDTYKETLRSIDHWVTIFVGDGELMGYEARDFNWLHDDDDGDLSVTMD